MAMKQKITMAYVEEYIAAHPDNKNIRGNRTHYTYFNHDASETENFPGEVRPGCVFGHIIASLGGGPEDVVEGHSISALNGNVVPDATGNAVNAPNVLDESLTPNDRSILRATQAYADQKQEPWADAFSMAKKEYGRV